MHLRGFTVHGGYRAPWQHRAQIRTAAFLQPTAVTLPAVQTSEPNLPWGSVALVTGANTGIGRVTARELARRGMHVFLACRSRERTAPVIEEIRCEHPGALAEWLPLELSDFGSVCACARAFLDRGSPLHLLVNNAGLAGARGLTLSGFECAFGVNHMGHVMLTLMLLDRLKASAPARVVTVASRAHRHARAIDWDAVRRPTATLLGVREYAVSKLANVLFSAELGRRTAGSGVTTYAVHPGVIDSDIWRTLPAPLRAVNRLRLATVEEGARTTLHCALSPAAGAESGLYYSDCRPVAPNAAGCDAALAAELWRRSEAWVGAAPGAPGLAP
jgi:NAD(P)-dependent dehydrogenase (short-subunit alcohol dehydrogenase family)